MIIIIANILVGFVAFLHAYFLILEMNGTKLSLSDTSAMR